MEWGAPAPGIVVKVDPSVLQKLVLELEPL